MHTRKFSWFVAMDREGCVLLYFTHKRRVACFPVFHTHTHTQLCAFSFLTQHTHTQGCVFFYFSHIHIHTQRAVCFPVSHTHRYTPHTHTHTTGGKDQTWPVLVNWQLIQLSRIHNILTVLFKNRLLENLRNRVTITIMSCGGRE